MRLFADKDNEEFLQQFKNALNPENEEMFSFTDKEMEIFYMGYRLAQFSDMYRSIKEIYRKTGRVVNESYMMFLWENFDGSWEELMEFERIARTNMLTSYYCL